MQKRHAIIKLYSILLFLCYLLNNSCALLEPNDIKPAVNIPQKWPNVSHLKSSKPSNLPNFQWWTFFKSPELNQLITQSLAQNNDIQTAIAQVEYAHSQWQEIKLSWLPNLIGLAGYSQFPIFGNPGTFAMGYPTYVINILQLYKQQKGAEALLKASRYAKEGIQLVVIASVATSYLSLIAQQEDLRLYQQLLHHYKLYLKLAKSQYQTGLSAKDAIEEISSQIQQIYSQIELTTYNINVSQNALHYLLNENPGPLSVTTSFAAIDSDGLIPGNLPVNVLSIRPDVGEAEALLLAAHADVGAVTAALLPTITLSAYLGKGSNVPGGINLTEAFVSTPLFDLPLFAQISGSKARYKTLYINYIDTIRRALRDISNGMHAYSAYTQQLKNSQIALRYLQHHCQLTKHRYKHGIDDKLSVVQCDIKVFHMKLIISRNKLKKMLSLVSLYQDLGGGYCGT